MDTQPNIGISYFGLNMLNQEKVCCFQGKKVYSLSSNIKFREAHLLFRETPQIPTHNWASINKHTKLSFSQRGKNSFTEFTVTQYDSEDTITCKGQ